MFFLSFFIFKYIATWQKRMIKSLYYKTMPSRTVAVKKQSFMWQTSCFLVFYGAFNHTVMVTKFTDSLSVSRPLQDHVLGNVTERERERDRDRDRETETERQIQIARETEIDSESSSK